MVTAFSAQRWTEPPAPAAQIGPNAVLQSLRAIAEHSDDSTARALQIRAGIPTAWPSGLIPETWFVRLVEAIREDFEPERAEAILERAGALTAQYVAANRIPRFAKRLLGWLPDRIATALLLAAIRRHAWTFAGSSTFDVRRGPLPQSYLLELDRSPTCRPSSTPTAMAEGRYYAAAFEGLLRMACPNATVREVQCRHQGANTCQFIATTNPEDHR